MMTEDNLLRAIGIKEELQRIRINGYDINYLVTGIGRPIVLVHGVNIGWGEWCENIPALSLRHRVYAFDMPGAGLSSPINFATADLEHAFVDTLEAFLEFHDLKDVILVGHSSGGWAVLKVALRGNSRVSKLVLVNSLGFSSYLVWRQRPLAIPGLARLLARTVIRPTEKNMRNFLSSVFVDLSGLREEFVDYYCRAVSGSIEAHPFLLISRLIRPFYIRTEFALGEALRSLKVPTLIVASDQDPLSSFAESSKHFSLVPQATVEIFKGSGHVPSMEQAKRFNDLVIKFAE